jgi:hypothetical protein
MTENEENSAPAGENRPREEHEMADIPETRREAQRQKGPIPANAIFLVFALCVAFFLFFGPPFATH